MLRTTDAAFVETQREVESAHFPCRSRHRRADDRTGQPEQNKVCCGAGSDGCVTVSSGSSPVVLIEEVPPGNSGVLTAGNEAVCPLLFGVVSAWVSWSCSLRARAIRSSSSFSLPGSCRYFGLSRRILLFLLESLREDWVPSPTSALQPSSRPVPRRAREEFLGFSARAERGTR